ncbi:MAG: T9SS type A sorting domain-containing protein [Bacteroidota bacterium]|nr:T9SS type A sorting domain-containing protein [Bacteroidota bacterium]
MKLSIVLFLMLLCVKTSHAQYCNFLGKDSVYVQISQDTVNVWDIGACAYCSSQFDISVRRSADSIYVVQTDTVIQKTTCDCVYNLKTSIVGLPSGTYRAIVYRQKLKKYGYSFDTLIFVRAIQFQYLSTISANFSFGGFQSGCNPSSVEDEIRTLPSEYILLQNYPNPFNISTVIKFQIPKPEYVALKVFDLLGREVRTLISEKKIEGTYKIPIDGSNLTSGLYFYQMRAGNFTTTKKMILLK